MNRIFTLIFLVVFSLSALSDFQTVLNASVREEYKAVFAELMPLAEQGNADAQDKLALMHQSEVSRNEVLVCFAALAG